VYHAVGILLTGFPLVLLFEQPFLTFPMDLAFGALIPIHSHIGWNYIISDYVPKQFRTIARYSTAGVTLVMFLGILKLNLAGPGLSKTLKSLWSSPENSEKSH
jgi:succinate dehydrogenase (ubiquinone) membrane anchor subunit